MHRTWRTEFRTKACVFPLDLRKHIKSHTIAAMDTFLRCLNGRQWWKRHCSCSYINAMHLVHGVARVSFEQTSHIKMSLVSDVVRKENSKIDDVLPINLPNCSSFNIDATVSLLTDANVRDVFSRALGNTCSDSVHLRRPLLCQQEHGCDLNIHCFLW